MDRNEKYGEGRTRWYCVGAVDQSGQIVAVEQQYEYTGGARGKYVPTSTYRTKPVEKTHLK